MSEKTLTVDKRRSFLGENIQRNIMVAFEIFVGTDGAIVLTMCVRPNKNDWCLDAAEISAFIRQDSAYFVKGIIK